MKAGFTLVELMIAIAIVGIVSVVIYSIFDTTSQNYYEVNQLADLNNRVRYATETVRNHLQAAGNQGSPDSELDARVFPKQAGVRVAGIYPYGTPGTADSWQDDRSMMPSGGGGTRNIAARNPEVSFDGFVVVGAFDFPLAFEFAGLQDPEPRLGRIYGDNRGIFKLATQDLFNAGVVPPVFDNSTGDAIVESIRPQWSTRVLRIADRQGFYQFIGVTDIRYEPNPDDPRHHYAVVDVLPDSDPLSPEFKGATGTGDFGLDVGDGDIAYDAGLLDAFWFHVEPSASDPNVLTLVRERLCASTVVKEGLASTTWDPSTALAPTCGGTAERVVVASHVADFQVWFDCADTTDGALRAATWDENWRPTDHATDCLGSTPQPGEVRGGHVRLALHTPTERTALQHIQFEDLAGAVCDPVSLNCDPARVDLATLRTFDFYPDTEGASRVVVMQSDFEVVNFVNRNVFN